MWCALLSTAYLCAWAQYSIDWYTVDGGGGTSTNAQHTVSGTIGQPDAVSMPMTGGSFSLTGGFWIYQAIQTVGAPFLNIVPSGVGQATISWDSNDPGWVLQETLGLTPASWVSSPSGTNNPIMVPASAPAKFFRLFKP
jgi:hypothetical protein